MFEVEKIAIVGTSCFLVPLAGSNVKRYPIEPQIVFYNMQQRNVGFLQFLSMRNVT